MTEGQVTQPTGSGARGGAAKARSAAAVEARNVTFAYSPAAGNPPELVDINLRVEADDYLGIIGPNGGGKTTLLKLMLGLLRPQKGQVEVFGQPPRAVRHQIGYVPQHARLDVSVPASVLDVVLTGRLSRSSWGMRYRGDDLEAAHEALASVGAGDLAHRAMGALSGGQRQRVLIARALASQPRILMLDEPTAGVDAPLERGLHELLAELNQGMPIIVVSHDIAFVSAQMKHVACLNRRVVCHTSGEITADVLAELYHDHGLVRLVGHRHDCPSQQPSGGPG